MRKSVTRTNREGYTISLEPGLRYTSGKEAFGQAATLQRELLATEQRVLGEEAPDTLATASSLAAVRAAHAAPCQAGDGTPLCTLVRLRAQRTRSTPSEAVQFAICPR